jgi:sugar transferase (PEP-CTERM system associated)
MGLLRIITPSSVLGLLISEAMLALTCYVVALYLILNVDPLVFLIHNHGLARIGMTVAAVLLGFYFQDLYEDLRVRSRTFLGQQVCLAIGLAFILQALVNYVSRDLVLPRWVMMTGSAFALVALTSWRAIYASFVESAFHAERVLFLGTSKLARQIEWGLAEKPQLGMVSLGYVGDPVEGDDPLPEGVLLGPLEGFRRVVEEKRPDLIVVSMSERRDRLPQSDLLELRFSGVQIQEAATAYETAFDRICVRELRPSQLIYSSELGPRPGTVLLQSLYSTVIAALGLVLAAPLLLLIAILVKLTSRGPVLHRQERVGRNEVPFILYKFRSMYIDAEARTGAVWATKNDPRITPLGRWLRRFRLDELPQLLNVLRGEMSIVGPRPERPEFVKTLVEKIPFYRQRLCVKPGITGWAQINHEYGDTLEDAVIKLEYDLYYIKNLTPAIDAYIMFTTSKVMLLGRGAH